MRICLKPLVVALLCLGFVATIFMGRKPVEQASVKPAKPPPVLPAIEIKPLARQPTTLEELLALTPGLGLTGVVAARVCPTELHQ